MLSKKRVDITHCFQNYRYQPSNHQINSQLLCVYSMLTVTELQLQLSIMAYYLSEWFNYGSSNTATTYSTFDHHRHGFEDKQIPELWRQCFINFLYFDDA